MSDISPFLIDGTVVPMPETFLLPICTTPERFRMMISALVYGGCLIYGEKEVLHYVDFIQACSQIREDCNVSYDDLIAAIEAAQADATAALEALAALPKDRDFSLYPDEASLIVDSTAISINTAYVYGLSQFQSTAFAAMRWHKLANLASGGTFKIWYSRFPTGGISTLGINGVALGTINMYNATTIHNQFTTLTLAPSVHGYARHQIDLSNTGAGTGAGRGQGLAKLWFVSS